MELHLSCTNLSKCKFFGFGFEFNWNHLGGEGEWLSLAIERVQQVARHYWTQWWSLTASWKFKILRSRKIKCHLANDVWPWKKRKKYIQMFLNFVLKCSINNQKSLVWIMAWYRTGGTWQSITWTNGGLINRCIYTYIYMCVCVTRPQWVNGLVLFS